MIEYQKDLNRLAELKEELYTWVDIAPQGKVEELWREIRSLTMDIEQTIVSGTDSY